MNYVWILSQGCKHEGGAPVAAYGTEEAAEKALQEAVQSLRLRVTTAYHAEIEWCKQHQYDSSSGTLEEFLDESWEMSDPNRVRPDKTFYCGADFVSLERFEIQT